MIISKNKIFTLTLVFLMFFLISSVSATDENILDFNITSVSDSDIILTNNLEDINTRGSDYYTFSEFNEKIAANSIVNLDKDVKYVESDGNTFKNGIFINKEVVINGNGHIVDASQKGKIFRLNNPAQLTINNIILQNGKAYSEVNSMSIGGGAIKLESGNLIADNCTFKNCEGPHGGAIYKDGTASNQGIVNIKNSLFIDNKAVSDVLPGSPMGGACYNNHGDLNFYNVKFINNNAGHGGALYSSDDGINRVNYCSFINNTADVAGIAVEGSMQDAEYKNSIFVGNTANNGKLITGWSINCNNNYWGTNDNLGSDVLEVSSNWGVVKLNINGNNNISEDDMDVEYTISFSNTNLPSFETTIISNPNLGEFNSNKIIINNQSTVKFNPNNYGNTTFIVGQEYNNLNTFDVEIIKGLLLKYNLTVKSSNIDYKDFLPVNITLKDAENNPLSATVTLTIDDINQDITVTNGFGSFDIENTLAPSEYEILAKYLTNDSSYKNASAKNTFNVFKGNLNIDLSSLNSTVRVGNKVILLADLTYKGNPVEGESITFKIGEDIIGTKITNSLGKAEFEYIPTNEGRFEFKATYADSNLYNNVESENLVLNVIHKLESKLQLSLLENESSEDSFIFSAKLTDSNNIAIENNAVIFKVNDVEKARGVTDDEGIVKFTYQARRPDYYLFKAIFQGNSLYNESTSNSIDKPYVTGNTFTDLAILIRGVHEGGTLVLDKDYVYDESVDIPYTDGIIIDKEITIEGNKNTISASNLSKIFRVSADLTLKNITLSDASSIEGGSIIYMTNGELTIVDSVLNNSKSIYTPSVAGDSFSIQNITDAAYYILNYIRTNNNYLVKYFTVNGTTLDIGQFLYLATKAAININNNDLSDITLIPSSYQDVANYKISGPWNSALTYSKNDYISHAERLVRWSQNNGNAANLLYDRVNGGEIYLTSLVEGFARIITYYDENGQLPDSTNYIGTIYPKEFSKYGGAISAGENTKKITIKNSKITNSTGNFAGALYSYNVLVEIMNSSFMDNNAYYDSISGGAICLYGDKTCYIENSLFKNNSAKNGYSAGAISASCKNTTIISSKFINNSGVEGGAVGIGQPTIIKDSFFLNNTALKGGAVSVRVPTFYKILSSIFLNNSADKGGAIHDLSPTGDFFVNYNIFINNNASEGMVYYNDEDNGFVNINYNYWGSNDNPEENGKIFNNSYYNFDSWIILDIEGLNYTYTSIPTDYTLSFKGENSDKLPDFNATIVIKPEIGNFNKDILNLSNNPNIAQFIANIASNGTIIIGEEYGNLTTFNLTVEKLIRKNYTLTLDSNDLVFADKQNITIKLLYADGSGVNDTINLKINENIYEIELVDGIGKYDFLASSVGNYNISVDYTSKTLFYNNISANDTFNVFKATPHMDVNVYNIKFGENEIIRVNITSGANGNVTLIINNISYTNTISGGKTLWNVSNLPVGEYPISLTYNGDDNYKSISINKTFTVSQVSSNMTVYLANTSFGEENIITVYLPESASGNVTLVINNQSYISPVYNGKALWNVSSLPAGFYPITLIYEGDGNFEAETVNETFTVSRVVSNMTVDLANTSFGEENIIAVYLPESASGNVTLVINNQSYISSVYNGKALWNVSSLPAGLYPITLNYTGDNNYDAITINNSFTILKAKANIELSLNDSYLINDLIIVKASLPDKASGNVTFTIANKKYSIQLINGIAAIQIINLTENDYLVEVKYDGDNNYLASENNTHFKVINNKKSNLISKNITMYYKNGTRFEIRLTDYENKPLANESILINVNGVYYKRITDKNGKASIAINLDPDNYTVYVVYNSSDFYDIAFEKYELKVLSTIIANDLVKIYCNGSQYYAKFVNGKGIGLNKTNVTFNINGVMYTRQTDENGLARLNINLDPREYIITAFHPVNNQRFSNKIKVLPTIIASDLIKYFKNESHYYAKLVDNQGNPIANKNLTFNINGVFYKRLTNEKGISRLKINLDPGEYILTAIDPNNNLKVANKITVLPKLFGEDIDMKVRDGTKYEVKLVDGKGKPLEGKNIRMNINGVFYERLTNEKGIARLNINLDSSSYIITSYYQDSLTSNNINVRV